MSCRSEPLPPKVGNRKRGHSERVFSLEEYPESLHFGSSQKGGFEKGGFGGCSRTPNTGTRVQKKERRYQTPEQGHKRRNDCAKSRNEGTFGKITLKKKKTARFLSNILQILEKIDVLEKTPLRKDPLSNPENRPRAGARLFPRVSEATQLLGYTRRGSYSPKKACFCLLATF